MSQTCQQGTHAPQQSDDHYPSNVRSLQRPQTQEKVQAATRWRYANAPTTSKTRVSFVMPLAVTDPTALNWKRD